MVTTSWVTFFFIITHESHRIFLSKWNIKSHIYFSGFVRHKKKNEYLFCSMLILQRRRINRKVVKWLSKIIQVLYLVSKSGEVSGVFTCSASYCVVGVLGHIVVTNCTAFFSESIDSKWLIILYLLTVPL